MVVVIKESQNIDVLSIQCLMRKLQANKERINEVQEDMSAHVLFSKQDSSGYSQWGRGRGQSKKQDEENANLKEKVMTASIS